MSYIRPLSEYKYVDENNPGDYIFKSCSCGDKIPQYIEDYGRISNPTLVDLIARVLLESKDFKDNDLYYVYLIKKLSEKLNVKMREEYLETEDIYDD